MRWAAAGVEDHAMSAVPAAYMRPPTTRTRPEPKRSASIPAKGWAAPHRRPERAMENAKISRPQPRSAETGCRKMPNEVRMPKDSAVITPAAAMRTTTRLPKAPGADAAGAVEPCRRMGPQ